MISKLKKLLKKTLIKAYTEKKDSFFILENTLRINPEDQTHDFSTFLIGSNIVQLNKNYCSKNLNLKLPLKLKNFDNFENLTLSLIKSKTKLGFSSLVLVKKDNLILKNQTHEIFMKSQEKKLCNSIILIKNFGLLVTKCCITNVVHNKDKIV